MRFINREFVRFIFWGGINTLAGYLIYAVLFKFVPYLAAYSAAYILSIFISYFLNAKFVFNQKLKLSRALTYPLVYLMQYLLGLVFLYLLVEVFKIHQLLAPALVVLLTVPVTFLLNRRVLKGKPGSSQNETGFGED